MTLYDATKMPLKTLAWNKWIDIDSGQLDDSDKRKSLKFPCSLIQVSSTFSNILEDGSLQQEASTVQIRLAWDATGSRTNANAPESMQDRSLNYTNQVKEIYALFQGTIIGDYDALECTLGQQEARNDGLIVYRFIFKTGRMIAK